MHTFCRMAIELKIPEVGESISEVEIGEWLKKKGDTVKKDENVVTIESEKASVELPAPASGRISRIVKNTGETAKVGEVVCYIEKDGEASESKEKEEAKEEETEKGGKKEPTGKKPREEESEKKKKEGKASEKEEEKEKEQEPEKQKEAAVRIMPAAARLIEEHQLDPDAIEGSGQGGRILKEDVLRYIEEEKEGRKEASQEEASEDEFSTDQLSEPGREVEVVRMTSLRRTVARRLVEAQKNMAMLTTFNEIDMSSLMTFRKEFQQVFQEKYEIKLGIMSFFVKAAVDALKLIPQVNAQIRGNDIVFHNYYDIGVAIGGGRGLVVPVLRNAERMSFAEVEQAIGDFAHRAQENKLRPEELQGGTFTISNGGVYGSLMSTPIVNPPQSGILGMHAIQERPVVVAGQVVVRPMMYVALSYDHRIVDGREAVTFLKRIKDVIESPARMLLEV